MQKREKIAWGIAVLSIAIMVSYFLVQKQRYDSVNRSLDEVKLERDRLRISLADSQKEYQRLIALTNSINGRLNEWLEVKSSLVSRTGKKAPSKVLSAKNGEFSKSCIDCMENFQLPVSIKDNKDWVRVDIKDSFHPEEGASVKLLPGFNRDIIEPHQKAIAKCNSDLDSCVKNLDIALNPPVKPEPPISFKADQQIFVGIGLTPSSSLGYNGEYAIDFMHIGSKQGLNINVGVKGGGFCDLTGQNVEAYGIGGVSLKW